MSIYPNPFESRASEHQRDLHLFVSTFGPGAIDLLPGAAWDRLVVLRSSPGAGKTSLMRLFSADALLWIRDRFGPGEPLRQVLIQRDVLTEEGGPLKLGVLLSLDRDYRSLVDLPVEPQVGDRLFLRLLDSRVMSAIVRASLATAGLEYPDAISRFSLDASQAEPKTQAALAKMGGPSGTSLLQYSRRTEDKVLELLDAVLKVDVEAGVEGHPELLSLDILEECTLLVDDNPLGLQPLLMFDDGHELAPRQRDVLLDNLRRRRPRVARWYAERFEALTDQELMQGLGSHGRDHETVDIDDLARNGSGHRFRAGQYNKILSHVALQRAAPVLTAYAQESQPFFALLEGPSDLSLPGDAEGDVAALRARVVGEVGTQQRYEGWLEEADVLTGTSAAFRWRELEILIARDRNRQQDLFATPLTDSDLSSRSSPALREAAALDVSKEFGLPYYCGEERLVALGSHNVEQFLNLCGVLFEDLLIDVSLGRKPALSAKRQHQLMRGRSEDYWESIARTVPNGRDVRAIVAEIVRIAVVENKKPTVPYPPGVTGTALLMAERLSLLDPEYRKANQGADRLFKALASAVAYNVITADLDYSVKGNRYMVLYLNRLLCPRFGLPLGRGAFRERRLSTMIGWVQNLPEGGYRDPFEAELSLDL